MSEFIRLRANGVDAFPDASTGNTYRPNGKSVENALLDLESNVNTLGGVAGEAKTLAEQNSVKIATAEQEISNINRSLNGVHYSTEKLIWENTNPSSNFGAQTITFDKEDFTQFLIIFGETNTVFSSECILSNKFPNGKLTYTGIGSSFPIIWQRSATLVSNGIELSDAKFKYTNASSETTQNDACIPYQIIGIKVNS